MSAAGLGLTLVAPPLAGPVAVSPGVGAVVVAVAIAAGAAALARARHRRAERLVARACHELRGPLCAARLGLEALAPMRDEDADRVAAIDLELRRAARALDDLALARDGRAAPDRPVVLDVSVLLAAAAGAWRALASSRGVEVVIEPPADPLRVHADPIRLAQACGNLVANAIEHGHGRTVTVRARRTGAQARIEVVDHGPGLPAPVAALAAAEPGSRSARGHGLAIAATIARRAGGRLAAAPSAHGARLVLELPALPADPAADARDRRTPVRRRRPAARLWAGPREEADRTPVP
jgi:signal transduction histidine kinase